jgi:hypothetical protein
MHVRRTGRTARSARITVAVLLTMAVFGGCSKADISAVAFEPDGTPAAVNCGTSIRSVSVEDVRTGALVWSAAAIDPDNSYSEVSWVLIGRAPTEWRELDPYRPGSAPSKWRFTIETYAGPSVIEAPSTGRSDEVLRVDGTETAQKWKEQTCTGLPFTSAVRVRIVLALVAVGAVAAAALVWYERRRRSAPQPTVE